MNYRNYNLAVGQIWSWLQSCNIMLGCIQHWTTEAVLWLCTRYDHGNSLVTLFWVVYSTELQKLCCGYVPGMIMVTVLPQCITKYLFHNNMKVALIFVPMMYSFVSSMRCASLLYQLSFCTRLAILSLQHIYWLICSPSQAGNIYIRNSQEK